MAPTKVSKKKKVNRRHRFVKTCDGTEVEKPNPFDLKVNHKKYNYVGRNARGEFGNPTESRSKAINKRRDRIMEEEKRKATKNTFRDRRLGQNNPNLTECQKHMIRLQAEKMRQIKDDKEEMSTGYMLSNKIDSKKSFMYDNDEDPASEDDELMNALLDGEKTEKQSLNDVIAASKLMKAKRIQEQLETNDATDCVDALWNQAKRFIKMRNDNLEAHRKKSRDEYDLIFNTFKFEPRCQVQSGDTNKMFETKSEFMARMEAEAEERMCLLKHELVYVSPDDLNDTVTLQDKKTGVYTVKKAEGRIFFFTELSLQNKVDGTNEETVPDTVEGFLDFLKENANGKMEALMAFVNPLTNGGEKEPLTKVFSLCWDALHACQYTPIAVSTSSLMARCIQTITVHYPVDGKKAFMERLEAMTGQTSVLDLVKHSVTLKLISMVYSVTDYKHPVASLALIKAAYLLAQIKIDSIRHCLASLVFIQVITQYLEKPRRFMPELISCLRRTLQFLTTSTDNNMLQTLADESTTLDFPKDLIEDKADVGRITMLTVKFAVQCTRQQACALYGMECTRKIFVGFDDLLDKVALMHPSIMTRVSESKAQLTKMMEFKSEKIVSMPMMLTLKSPKIQSRYLKQSFEMEMNRRRKYKKELRSTAREIKRDTQLASKLKMQDIKRSDEKRRQKVKQILSQLASQEGEFRKLKKSAK